MKIEIRKTRTDGIIQITTLDERWYVKTLREKVNNVIVERDIFNPSITWIEKYSPMGIGLLKYYANHGWDEAEMLKDEAAERGSKVHQACDVLMQGGKVTFESPFKDPDAPESKEKEQTLTPHEYWIVMTFAEWWKEFSSEHVVEVVDTEKTVWVDAEPGEAYGYAGTRDIKLKVDGEPWALDIKTSKAIYLGHELQLSAIKHADPDRPRTAIIQIGYAMNKRGFKFTETPDKFPLFQAAMKFWRDANPDTKPKQKDYPPEISLVFPDTEALKKLVAMKQETPIKKFPRRKVKVVRKKLSRVEELKKQLN